MPVGESPAKKTVTEQKKHTENLVSKPDSVYRDNYTSIVNTKIIITTNTIIIAAATTTTTVLWPLDFLQDYVGEPAPGR